MSLTLRVQSYRKQAPAVPVERRFDQLGGTIGRAAGNDLELPDPGKYISRNHSKIDFADGRYTLMDLGANPSWINDRPVGTGKVANLEHGDRLMIGDYVLEVVVEHGAPVVVPVFSTETSDALPFQAQPHDPAGQAAPEYEPVADTLAGMKVLDVAGRFDPLAAPSANDPLGLGQPDGAPPVPTPQQAAAYRGSEPDHVAPQFIPMPGSLLPGQQPGIAAPDGAGVHPQPAFGQPPQAPGQAVQVAADGAGAYPQSAFGQPPQAPGQPAVLAAPPFGQRPGQVSPPFGQQPAQMPPQPSGQQPAQVPQQAFGHPAAQVPPQAMGQPFAYAQPQPPGMQPELPPLPQAMPPLQAQSQPDTRASQQPYPEPDPQASSRQPGHWQQLAAAQPHAWPQPFPAAGAQAVSPLQPSPYAPEPTVLVMRTPTAAPTLPPAPAMLIPDDYDPLADLAPRAPAQAQGWPQAMPPAGGPAPVQPVQPTVMQTMGPGAGWPAPAQQAAPPGAWNGAGQPAIPASWPDGQPQAAWQSGAMQAAQAAQAGWPGAAQPYNPQHGQAHAQQQAAAGWTPPAPGPQAWPGQMGQGLAGQGDAILQALLRGMGLSALQLSRDPVQTAELAGAMLREAMAGTMAVLMARAMTKRESRLDMTVLGAQANNPLKFFPDAESALAQMLTNAMSGYMPPVKAIGSAFDDLKAHELAVIAGMRAALKGVMARFDPAQIEASEPQGVMDKMMTAARKARMWDSMVALYDDIVREADDDFQHLFGEKFSAAYEDQIGRLHRNP